MRKKNKNTLSERIGQISKNKYGSLMEIIEYNGANDIWVKFENGKPVHTNYKAFCQGKIRNVYNKSTYNIGYIGEGKYKPSLNGKNTPQYTKWTSMIKRCYDEKYQERQPTYKGVTVIEEWHNFQNFAKWYDENYYEIEGEIMCLDKDILIKGNKIYSPETCVFAPDCINNLFIKNDTNRGNLPIGVSAVGVKYRASCTDGNGKIKKLGMFNTPEEAFYVYKKAKEELIKQLANKYAKRIPSKLYEAMNNYEIKIND